MRTLAAISARDAKIDAPCPEGRAYLAYQRAAIAFGLGHPNVLFADEMGLDARVIRGALEFRVQSENDPSYAGQVLSALRNQFGGHAM